MEKIRVGSIESLFFIIKAFTKKIQCIVFGKVVSGMEVVRKIENQATSSSNAPLSRVEIWASGEC